MTRSEDIRRDLIEGVSAADILAKYSITKSTLSWHRQKVGKAKKLRKYDWGAVNEYLASHGVRETIRHFGMAHQTWQKAVARGDVARKPRKRPPEVVFETCSHRGALKRALQQVGVPSTCNICGLFEWLGKPISLALDHVNGIKTDNRRENLRLLCPNCHSQTPTFSGRNASKVRRAVRQSASIGSLPTGRKSVSDTENGGS